MTRGGRKPREDEEGRICEASLTVGMHMRGHWQGRASCVCRAGKGHHMAGTCSKNKRERRGWRRSGSRNTSLLFVKSWNSSPRAMGSHWSAVREGWHHRNYNLSEFREAQTGKEKSRSRW